MTTVAQAIKAWEAKNESSAEEGTEINLCFQTPPIAKLDTKVMGSLKKCQKLSLSTNMIDRMVNLTGILAIILLPRWMGWHAWRTWRRCTVAIIWSSLSRSSTNWRPTSSKFLSVMFELLFAENEHLLILTLHPLKSAGYEMIYSLEIQCTVKLPTRRKLGLRFYDTCRTWRRLMANLWSRQRSRRRSRAHLWVSFELASMVESRVEASQVSISTGMNISCKVTSVLLISRVSLHLQSARFQLRALWDRFL